MPLCPTQVFHCIAGKPTYASSVPFAFPTFPSYWRRAFNIYETWWASTSGGNYIINEARFEQNLAWMERPNATNIIEPEQHSAGAIEPDFDGPLCLDMEMQPSGGGISPFVSHPATLIAMAERVKRWRPRADVFLYGSIVRASYDWDSAPPTVRGWNDRHSQNVPTPAAKHVPLYLKNDEGAEIWEGWNDRNCFEVMRAARRTGGRAYVMVSSQDWDGSTITTQDRLLAQVRPAIRYGLDIIVWDYWTNTAARDAAIPGIAAMDTAIRAARADLWGE